MTRLISSVLALVVAACSIDANAAAPNLVLNGNVELGNVDFDSDYGYSPGINSTEGQYTVCSDPFPWNSLFISAPDHTSGSGAMYVGNGSPADGAKVWQSASITVTPNTDYFFEAYVMNVCCSAPFPGNSRPFSSSRRPARHWAREQRIWRSQALGKDSARAGIPGPTRRSCSA